MQNRHAPLRSCIMCGAKKVKRELFRIVRTAEQECVLDETGKRPGRGAYLCGRPDCWRGAAQGKRLTRALRGEITPDDREWLAAFGRELYAAAKASSQ